MKTQNNTIWKLSILLPLVTELLFLLPALRARPSLDRDLASDVDAFIETIMSVSGLPGLAIAVVAGDGPILIKGYGFADAERRIPVDEYTAFYIASNTKAITALAVSLMADRKMIGLDAPITRYLPDARWGAGVIADSISIRHLLSHTHGIEGGLGPVVWRTAFTGVHTNTLLKELLQHHGPNKEGRGNYRYTNLGYNIAGIIIDEITNSKWQDVLDSLVLSPAGMSSTTPYLSRMDSFRLAMPHVLEPDGLRRVHYAKTDANMAAAGGHVSTAVDIARWLELQINRGRLDGRQVFPERVMAETHRLQVVANENRGEVKIVGYSLGWFVGVQADDTVMIHSGGFSSFRSSIAFVPARSIGVAVMTNEAIMGSGATEYVVQYVLDRSRSAASAREKYARRLDELPAIVERTKARIVEARSQRASRPQTLTKPLDAYSGVYENGQYGVMTWAVQGNRLWTNMGVLKSVAEVFDHQTDALRVELEPGNGQVVQFKFEKGRAVALTYAGHEFIRR
jgi:CubicO group peptidase (beta-lactamase class C family)